MTALPTINYLQSIAINRDDSGNRTFTAYFDIEYTKEVTICNPAWQPRGKHMCKSAHFSRGTKKVRETISRVISHAQYIAYRQRAEKMGRMIRNEVLGSNQGVVRFA